MKKGILIFGLALLGFAACQSEKKESKSWYEISNDVPGPTIKEGDFIAFKAIQKTEEDSVIFNSWKDERFSYMPQKKPLFKNDLYAGLALLSEGDSATFKIDLDSLNIKMGLPKPANTKGKYMIYVMKIFKVIPRGKLDEKTFNEKARKYIAKEDTVVKSKEDQKIAAYISSRGLKPQTTSSGLKYILRKRSAGDKPVQGDTLVIDYTASFLTGKVFKTSHEDIAKKANLPSSQPYGPIKAVAGNKLALPGVNEALLMFPSGTGVTLILPSRLAYGSQGNRLIMPYTPVIFDIDILKIIHPKAAKKH